ncbi:MAG: glycosyltransferase family 39 protein [Bacteroidota bacterium]
MSSVKDKLSKYLLSDISLFVIMIVILSFIYGYQRTTFIPPQGLHQYRQCVSAAFAMNYYNYDLDITQTRLYNHLAEKGGSDVVLAECPVLYYFVGILYTIFGNHDSIFRIVNALLLFIGLFYLFKSLRILLQDKFWALFVTAIIFTSPTLIYYGNNFLPDTSAFGLVFIALYHLVRYSREQKNKYLYFAAIIFALAGLLKITALVSLMAVMSTFVFFWLFDSNIRSTYKFRVFVFPMLIPFIVVGAWYLFVSYYHANYGASVSPVDIRPFWRLDQEAITATLDRIQNEWLHSYFNIYLLIFIGCVLLSNIIFFRRSNKFLAILTYISIVGAAGFFLLFFSSFRLHDYYMINLFIIIIFILITGLMLLKQYAHRVYKNYLVKIVFTAALVFLALSAVKEVDFKYNSYHNNRFRHKFYGLVGIEEVNRNLGIQPRDLVISIPDKSINISLYLMNQPGFTDFGFNAKKGAGRMEFFISKGAKYLIVSDSTIYEDTSYQYLRPYLAKRIGEFKNIDIYDIRID